MSNDWWSKKLGGGGNPAPPPATTTPQQQSPMQRTAQGSGMPMRPEAKAAPQDVTEGAARIHDSENYDGIRRKSVETGNDGTCPECGGHNYFENIRSGNRATGGKPATPRCYECGYPITHGLNAS